MDEPSLILFDIRTIQVHQNEENIDQLINQTKCVQYAGLVCFSSLKSYLSD